MHPSQDPPQPPPTPCRCCSCRDPGLNLFHRPGIDPSLLSSSFSHLSLAENDLPRLPVSLNHSSVPAADSSFFLPSTSVFYGDNFLSEPLEMRVPPASGSGSFSAELPAVVPRELIERHRRIWLAEALTQPLFLGPVQGLDRPLEGFDHRSDDGNCLETTLLPRRHRNPRKTVSPRKLSDAACLLPLQISGELRSLEEMKGRICEAAKDQHGCRLLQRRLDESNFEDIQKVFSEVHPHLIELMTDPFGNYLVQKLMEVCYNNQYTQILQAVTSNNYLVDISLNMHGTRAVQKLIETLRTSEQVARLVSSLKPVVVTLIKDLNGNHVVQHCLQYLSPEDNEFIYRASLLHCVEIASHRRGCCVLQRCIEFASTAQRFCLVAEITSHALQLSQDPFGNYVVQYVLKLGLPWASSNIISGLQCRYPLLAMQKFSSNVVEKCVKFATDDEKTYIIYEIVTSVLLEKLLQDPFANYVIQAALEATKGDLHDTIVEAIRPHIPLLRSNLYGKRILSRTHLKR